MILTESRAAWLLGCAVAAWWLLAFGKYVNGFKFIHLVISANFDCFFLLISYQILSRLIVVVVRNCLKVLVGLQVEGNYYKCLKTLTHFYIKVIFTETGWRETALLGRWWRCILAAWNWWWSRWDSVASCWRWECLTWGCTIWLGRWAYKLISCNYE